MGAMLVFANLKSMMVGFVWGSGRRRVALKTLMRPRVEGGLAVPDFELYYIAAQLQVFTQAVTLDFRGPDSARGGGNPRHVLSFIALQQRLDLRDLTLEEKTLRLCRNKSQRRAGLQHPYASEIPLGMLMALPHGGDWSSLRDWEQASTGGLIRRWGAVDLSGTAGEVCSPRGRFLDTCSSNACITETLERGIDRT